jgi:hypothetical protein
MWGNEKQQTSEGKQAARDLLIEEVAGGCAAQLSQ